MDTPAIFRLFKALNLDLPAGDVRKAEREAAIIKLRRNLHRAWHSDKLQGGSLVPSPPGSDSKTPAAGYDYFISMKKYDGKLDFSRISIAIQGLTIENYDHYHEIFSDNDRIVEAFKWQADCRHAYVISAEKRRLGLTEKQKLALGDNFKRVCTLYPRFKSLVESKILSFDVLTHIIKQIDYSANNTSAEFATKAYGASLNALAGFFSNANLCALYREGWFDAILFSGVGKSQYTTLLKYVTILFSRPSIVDALRSGYGPFTLEKDNIYDTLDEAALNVLADGYERAAIALLDNPGFCAWLRKNDINFFAFGATA